MQTDSCLRLNEYTLVPTSHTGFMYVCDIGSWLPIFLMHVIPAPALQVRIETYYLELLFQ